MWERRRMLQPGTPEKTKDLKALLASLKLRQQTPVEKVSKVQDIAVDMPITKVVE